MSVPEPEHATDAHGRDHRPHEHGHSHGHSHGQGFWGGLRHALTPHAHDASEAIQTAEESTRDGIRTAWIGLAGMTATALAQIVIVAVSGSVALLADTIHNIGHAATTIPLIFAFWLGRRPPSKRYPFGYRRAEDLVGLFISLVIAGSVVLIVWESVDALLHPRPLTNLGWVFAAGVVGFVGNEAVAVYRIRTGRRIGSAALIAEGQHARADGYTSLAVVAGAVGVALGLHRADAIAGLLIAVAITGILVNSLVLVVRRLMDGIEPQTVDALRAAALRAPGVHDVGAVRARWLGHRMEADVTISVDPSLDVRLAHDIADEVEARMRRAGRHLDRVCVHVHPAATPQAQPRAGSQAGSSGIGP